MAQLKHPAAHRAQCPHQWLLLRCSFSEDNLRQSVFPYAEMNRLSKCAVGSSWSKECSIVVRPVKKGVCRFVFVLLLLLLLLSSSFVVVVVVDFVVRSQSHYVFSFMLRKVMRRDRASDWDLRRSIDCDI
jgi:hypothetical protein